MNEVEIPSKVPIEGWARGIDGNWWPPAPPRQRPAPTLRTEAPRRARRPRRIVGIIAIIILVALVGAIVAAIISSIVDFEDRPSSTVGEATPAVYVAVPASQPA